MSRPEAPFSIWKFSVSVVIQYSSLLVGFSFFAPTTWSRQLAAGPGAFFLVWIGSQLFLCFFEWGFHRYVLHSVMVPWLKHMARGHRNHHALTNIQLQKIDAGPGNIVLCNYPITRVEQHEDESFPPYALVAFWLLFTPFLMGGQLLWPNAPIYFGGYTAITFGMFAYEAFHAVEHRPYEWWKQATEHPRFGGLWRKIYGFHHFHHANVGSNEGISGFFGLPVADWVFRTYHQPQQLLLHNRMATAKEFKAPPPWPFVSWLDRWARKREAKLLRPTSA